MSSSPGDDHRNDAKEQESADSGQSDLWQQGLLPLMKRVVITLTLFFFVITLGQLFYLYHELQKSPSSIVPHLATTLLIRPQNEGGSPDLPRDQMALAAVLESEVIMRRYHMASAILMAHLWIRYLGFITGMIMAVMGAVFILGKLRESSASTLGTEVGSLTISLTSTSPGIVLAVLGAVLMNTTILAQQETSVKDLPLYQPFSGGQLPKFFPNGIEKPNIEETK